MENEIAQNSLDGFQVSLSYTANGPEALIINLVVFLISAWGLYNVNKKLGEPAAWLAFFPILNIYSFVKAAGKSGIWVLWLILGTLLFIIPGLVIFVILCNEISKRTGNGIGTTLGLVFLFPIFIAIVGYKLDPAKIQANNTKPQEL